MECQICKKQLTNLNGLAKHIRNQHSEYDKKTFYDKFLKKEGDGACKTCKSETTFRGLQGYLEFCSVRCRSMDPEVRNKLSSFATGRKQSEETVLKRIENTDQVLKEQNRIKSLQDRYGNDVTNPSHTPGWKEKYRETSLKNWGTEYPAQNPKVFNRVMYKKRTVNINGYEFVIQGYEDLFLQQLHEIFPCVMYEDLLEERTKTLFRKNGSVHYPDFYSKKHNHMFEVKSEWTFEKNKEDVLRKKSEAEEQGYKYSIVVWKRRNLKPRII